MFKDLDKSTRRKLDKKALLKYNVYKESLYFKIESAIFSIDQIKSLKNRPIPNKHFAFFTAYFLEHFFVSLYSCYDISAQIINVVLKVNKKENDIFFTSISGVLSSRKIKNYIQESILKQPDFESFKKYRHCISHRRIPRCELVEVTHKTIAPCVQYETTDSTGRHMKIEKKTINIYLTSDPNIFDKKVTKKVEAIDYCENFTKWTKHKLWYLFKKVAKEVC